MNYAQRQADLVSSLVAGADDPAGFDAARLAAARAALLRKRAGEVAAAWPELRLALGTRWSDRFAEWARDRRPAGALSDGWSLARELGAELPPAARVELAARECTHRFDGLGPPIPRRGPALRLVAGHLIVRFGGRMWIWNRNRSSTV
ncbi:hypothetical protein F4553_003774 [Allocatelliglobosispora scoriae]|uniref:SCO6045-like C-terminal domain-containing protein n=1 Tax=Allocatelliglobosispora scoriae TaxID=643052 RepID=A0A841BRR7_9ACTN|nr:hypothetical protein [Allocatelliglobosispora scoriae]MBB5870395.1 hypothetical protein [Allocatelliglobosispora scoriae]